MSPGLGGAATGREGRTVRPREQQNDGVDGGATPQGGLVPTAGLPVSRFGESLFS